MSNLSKYEMAETAILHLRDASDALMYADGADGQPDLTKPMRAHLYGPGSKQYAKAQNARQNHQVDLLKGRGKTKESAEDAAREQAEFLAACTQSLENIDETPFEVYSNRKLSFIPTQIGVFLNETGNFTPGSATP